MPLTVTSWAEQLSHFLLWCRNANSKGNLCCCVCAELSMPCDQYELHLQNSVAGPNANPDVAVASLDQSISTVTGVQLGHVNVVLDHKSILLMKYACYCNGIVQCSLSWYLQLMIYVWWFRFKVIKVFLKFLILVLLWLKCESYCDNM